VLLSQSGGSATLRYWYTGTFTTGKLTLTFKDGAYNELDAANTATPVSGLAPLDITVDANHVSSTWIDVRFSTVGGVVLDDASFADAARELALSGSGLGGLAGLLQLTPTRLSSSNDGIDNNSNGIVDEADENVWRFYVSRGFIEGSVAVTLTGANWSDKSGNHGQNAVQAFQVISTLKQSNGQGGQTVGKVFYIEISGGIKLQGLGFADEPSSISAAVSRWKSPASCKTATSSTASASTPTAPSRSSSWATSARPPHVLCCRPAPRSRAAPSSGAWSRSRPIWTS
jgi:hypothetical protein